MTANGNAVPVQEKATVVIDSGVTGLVGPPLAVQEIRSVIHALPEDPSDPSSPWFLAPCKPLRELKLTITVGDVEFDLFGRDLEFPRDDFELNAIPDENCMLGVQSLDTKEPTNT